MCIIDFIRMLLPLSQILFQLDPHWYVLWNVWNVNILKLSLFLSLDIPDFRKLPPAIPTDFIYDFDSTDLPGREISHYNPLRNDFEIVRVCM